jgi:hypothetical protein
MALASALLACEAPPAAIATAPLATPSAPDPSPPASTSAPPAPKPRADVFGPDAAATMIQKYGSNDVAPTIQRTAHCRDGSALDGGPSADASVATDGGSPTVVAPAPWKSFDPRQWQSALHGYPSRVGRQHPRILGAAATPFAKWLVAVHNRVHPWWADGFLGWLETLPCDDARNDARLHTELELVVKGDTGRIVSIGVVVSSGVEAFDLAAITAFVRASPFPVADAAIRSSDGNVYFLWEVHRAEEYACSAMGVRPYLLDLSTMP